MREMRKEKHEGFPHRSLNIWRTLFHSSNRIRISPRTLSAPCCPLLVFELPYIQARVYQRKMENPLPICCMLNSGFLALSTPTTYFSNTSNEFRSMNSVQVLELSLVRYTR